MLKLSLVQDKETFFRSDTLKNHSNFSCLFFLNSRFSFDFLHFKNIVHSLYPSFLPQTVLPDHMNKLSKTFVFKIGKWVASIEEVTDAITNMIMYNCDFKIQCLEGGCEFCIKLQLVVSRFFFLQNMFSDI